MGKWVTLLCLILTLTQTTRALNNRPIVGVVSQPPDPSLLVGNGVNVNVHQIIVASYVKWLEAAGARVVPVLVNSSKADLTSLVKSINGLLFPGGGQTLNPGQPFYDQAIFLYNLAVEANQKGDYFPVWGTCQGFQFLNIAASTLANESVLSHYNSWDYSWPLDFTPDSKTSRMFGNAPANIYNIFGTENVTMNWHHYGVSPNMYKVDSKLAAFYDILSLNSDVNGNVFISAVEGKNMPFYGTQFHPEWSVYEWDPTAAASHTGDAVAAMNYLAQFFMSEVRKSNHTFPTSQAEAAALIYNYSPEYTEMITGDLQTYYF